MSRNSRMQRRNLHQQRIRLFRNEHLERLTMVSPVGFAGIWCVILPFVTWVGWGAVEPFTARALFGAGLVGWTLLEYAMHRHLFHWAPRAQILRQFVFMMHGNHHVDISDPMRSLMPPVVSLPIAGTVWALCVALIGPAGTWAFLGLVLGYVAYDVTHYACHQWPVKGRISRMLKRHHMRHHYRDQEANFAITAIFLDRLFGSLITSGKPRGR